MIFIISGIGFPRGRGSIFNDFVVSAIGILRGVVALSMNFRYFWYKNSWGWGSIFSVNFIVSGIGIPRGWGSIFNDVY